MIVPGTTLKGASHADELCYLFKCQFLDKLYETLPRDSLEVRSIKLLTNLWANFAKYG